MKGEMMKREFLKALAIDAGFEVAGIQGFLVATGLEGAQDHKLRKLVELVEKATLERAAKVCDEFASNFKNKSAENDGRESDFAFGAMNALECVATEIRGVMHSNE